MFDVHCRLLFEHPSNNPIFDSCCAAALAQLKSEILSQKKLLVSNVALCNIGSKAYSDKLASIDYHLVFVSVSFSFGW